MKRSIRKSILLLSLLLAMGGAGLMAQRTGDEVAYSASTYEVSTDPTKVVLQVVLTAGLSGAQRSMTVYGDGAVVLKRSVLRGGAGEEQRRTEIGTEGVRELLNLATSTGLAEWDSDTIRAWMLEDSPRVPGVSDGGKVRVALRLLDYRRGAYRPGALSKTFTVNAPSIFARYFPQITQFGGVARLLEKKDELWEASGGGL